MARGLIPASLRQSSTSYRSRDSYRPFLRKLQCLPAAVNLYCTNFIIIGSEEQIRAANALAYARAGLGMRGRQGGNVLKKLPALVMSNGLLAAGAFAYAQKGDIGWRTCFDHVAKHLSHPEIGIAPGRTTSTS
jgi:hypothetical protein